MATALLPRGEDEITGVIYLLRSRGALWDVLEPLPIAGHLLPSWRGMREELSKCAPLEHSADNKEKHACCIFLQSTGAISTSRASAGACWKEELREGKA